MSATRARISLAAMVAVAILASLAARNDYGLESAKPDLQSTFKKPGRGVIRRALLCARARTITWGLLRCVILAQKRESRTGNSPRSGSAGSRDASQVVRGIGCVMMSGAAAGCQADRARRRAFGVGTRGGRSVPAALAADLNVAFRSMLTPPGGECCHELGARRRRRDPGSDPQV